MYRNVDIYKTPRWKTLHSLLIKAQRQRGKKIQKLAGKLVFFQKHDKEMFICTENEHRRKRSMEGSSGMRQREEELWVDLGRGEDYG